MIKIASAEEGLSYTMEALKLFLGIKETSDEPFFNRLLNSKTTNKSKTQMRLLKRSPCCICVILIV